MNDTIDYTATETKVGSGEYIVNLSSKLVTHNGQLCKMAPDELRKTLNDSVYPNAKGYSDLCVPGQEILTALSKNYWVKKIYVDPKVYKAVFNLMTKNSFLMAAFYKIACVSKEEPALDPS